MLPPTPEAINVEEFIQADPAILEKITVQQGLIILKGYEQLLQIRTHKNRVSIEKMQTAKVFADSLLNSTSYLKILAVCGSVAYGTAAKAHDIDLFIVAQKDRMWIAFARALLRARIMNIKGLILGKPVDFCLSYVQDEVNFEKEITDRKNLLFAREFLSVKLLGEAKLGQIDFLTQGTLYPDVIELATSAKESAAAKIKTHHNVGGLPEDLRFQLIEPLRYLFKDEVRAVGTALGLPNSMVLRQPFPGPGLAIRIIGEVTPERLDILREADWIVVDEIKSAGLYRSIWQSFAILTPVRSVGVMGDGRTYANVVAIRAVTSEDAMTADWAKLPYDVLGKISSRIVNEVPGVNRVVYDISSKPPATIEWE